MSNISNKLPKNYNKNSRNKLNLSKALFYKSLSILAVVASYLLFITYTYASNNNYNNANRAPGVCVFDIDYTLACRGSYAAVQVCRNAGFELAINTARDYDKAYEYLYSGEMERKGFPPDFIEQAKIQNGLNGPFQYRESWSIFMPTEQKFQNKSYSMRKIAKHYKFKLDDDDSRKVVLFDDWLHNIVQITPNRLDPYHSSRCKTDKNNNCYYEPSDSFLSAVYPRNWKIYRSKWIGYMCYRWDDPDKAAADAYEMIQEVIHHKPRNLTPVDDRFSSNYNFN